MTGGHQQHFCCSHGLKSFVHKRWHTGFGLHNDKDGGNGNIVSKNGRMECGWLDGGGNRDAKFGFGSDSAIEWNRDFSRGKVIKDFLYNMRLGSLSESTGKLESS